MKRAIVALCVAAVMCSASLAHADDEVLQACMAYLRLRGGEGILAAYRKCRDSDNGQTTSRCLNVLVDGAGINMFTAAKWCKDHGHS